MNISSCFPPFHYRSLSFSPTFSLSLLFSFSLSSFLYPSFLFPTELNGFFFTSQSKDASWNLSLSGRQYSFLRSVSTSISNFQFTAIQSFSLFTEESCSPPLSRLVKKIFSVAEDLIYLSISVHEKSQVDMGPLALVTPCSVCQVTQH